jgi:hypothetical protein
VEGEGSENGKKGREEVKERNSLAFDTLII